MLFLQRGRTETNVNIFLFQWHLKHLNSCLLLWNNKNNTEKRLLMAKQLFIYTYPATNTNFYKKGKWCYLNHLQVCVCVCVCTVSTVLLSTVICVHIFTVWWFCVFWAVNVCMCIQIFWAAFSNLHTANMCKSVWADERAFSIVKRTRCIFGFTVFSDHLTEV